jgi:rSAM/selenodomain-associated transferase 2
VVDGGSQDDTIARARAAGASKVFRCSSSGRSIQMNLGAEKSSGDVLVFLHADSTLPSGYDKMIEKEMSPLSSWGCFRSIDIASNGVNPLFAFLMKQSVALRTSVFHKPYGDQALFIRKTTFCEIGGYRSDWKLLEDVDLVEKLNKKCGSPAIVPQALKTSGRRWDRLGALRTTCINQYILFRYAMGDSVNELEKLYRKKS